MKPSKKVIIPSIALSALLLLGVYGVTKAAEQPTPPTRLIERLSQRFNVSQAEVADVFQQHIEEKLKFHRAQVEKKLTQGVADGKITNEQKNQLLSKWDEVVAERKKDRQELRSWATANGYTLPQFCSMGFQLACR